MALPGFLQLGFQPGALGQRGIGRRFVAQVGQVECCLPGSSGHAGIAQRLAQYMERPLEQRVESPEGLFRNRKARWVEQGLEAAHESGPGRSSGPARCGLNLTHYDMKPLDGGHAEPQIFWGDHVEQVSPGADCFPKGLRIQRAGQHAGAAHDGDGSKGHGLVPSGLAN